MIRYLFLTSFILLTGWQAATAQQARFDRATDLLEVQEYREAIDLYKSIADDGYSSGALWFNLGVAYATLDSLGVSKYYLMKAEQHREIEAQAREALDFVNERFTRRSSVLPPLPWDRFFANLARSPGESNLYIIGFLVLYGGVALFITSWFVSGRIKLWRYSGLTVILISALIFSSALYLSYQSDRYGTGVLKERQSVVYQQPEPESAAVSTAYEGYTMRIDHRRSESEDEWYFVRLENGMTGWIERGGLLIF
ncbi:MAG: SH3 domain-containing protein [Balneolaceae bacterium]|nr:SH3 domain-containing protein [Balneolaceae bacterium]MCH8548137.1 SH3 domain-containing protein [Balneolaceae bacterium]